MPFEGQKSLSPSIIISVNRAPVFVSLACGPESCATTVNATVKGAGHLVVL